MALTTTTLAAACGRDDVTIKVTSATGFADKQLIRVDAEIMAQAGTPSTTSPTSIPVRRGIDGTAQLAHGILANVATGLVTDFPVPPPGQIAAIAPDAGRRTLGVDTTLNTADFPPGPSTYVITKATAAAITLGAPSKAQDGLRVTFLSGTAAAHTVTYAAGFYGDTTASDIATFAAKVGASMTLEAQAGAWGPLALTNVTAA
jgi:hypothetical protein